MPKNCKQCGVQIDGKSKSDYCSEHRKTGQAQQNQGGANGTMGVQWENSKNLEKSSDSELVKNMETYGPAMHKYLTSKNCWKATKATSFGDQDTPPGCDVDSPSKVTLDFQGIRAGTNGTFWIDIQAQKGGGGSKRKSYGQVMIQTNMNSGRPSAKQLTDLMIQSIKANAQRVLILDDGQVGRPVSG